MPNPTKKWDHIPVFGVYTTMPGDTPVAGSVQFKLSQRITRADGRTIHPDGATVKVNIGVADEQNSAVRAAVRTAWRAADAAAAGVGFDGAAWDVDWDTKILPAAIFTEFPASDDPDVVQHEWTVTVRESLTNAAGREYAIQPLLAHLETTIPGINLGTIEVPPGSPSVAAPVYAKGIAGGIAALDNDGDVVDADGVKVAGGLPEDATLDDLADGATSKHFTAANQTKLAGIATAATANDSDANLRNRSNHTGSQAISTVTGLQTALDAKAPLASPAFTGTPTGITKAHVGLGSVDNTADTAKPVSTAQQTALNLKANLASPAFTGTPTGITKAHVGLANVDNTTDATKQTAFLLALPTQTYIHTWSGTAWQYKAVDATAVPAGVRTGDLLMFVGNPGGTLPAWAPVGSVWTQG